MAGTRPPALSKFIMMGRPFTDVRCRSLCSATNKGLILDETKDLVRAKLFAPFEEGQLDEEGTTSNLAAGLLDKLAAGAHGAAGGEQVIHEKHTGAFGHAVTVHVQLGAAIFKFILEGIGAIRQLARLAERDER